MLISVHGGVGRASLPKLTLILRRSILCTCATIFQYLAISFQRILIPLEPVNTSILRRPFVIIGIFNWIWVHVIIFLIHLFDALKCAGLVFDPQLLDRCPLIYTTEFDILITCRVGATQIYTELYSISITGVSIWFLLGADLALILKKGTFGYQLIG